MKRAEVLGGSIPNSETAQLRPSSRLLSAAVRAASTAAARFWTDANFGSKHKKPGRKAGFKVSKWATGSVFGDHGGRRDGVEVPVEAGTNHMETRLGVVRTVNSNQGVRAEKLSIVTSRDKFATAQSSLI